MTLRSKETSAKVTDQVSFYNNTATTKGSQMFVDWISCPSKIILFLSKIKAPLSVAMRSDCIGRLRLTDSFASKQKCTFIQLAKVSQL